MKNTQQTNPFYKNLGTGLFIFSGYSIVLTFFINLMLFFILPFANQSLSKWLSPEREDPLPLLDQLVSQVKMGAMGLFIFLLLLLISSFFLRKGKPWARFATLLLLIATLLLIIYTVGLLINQWTLFNSIPLPFWLLLILIALIAGLGVILAILSIQMVRTKPHQ